MPAPKKSRILPAYIALRVSTDHQAKHGVSISRDDDPGFQEDHCRKFADMKGWIVSGVYTDAGVTGRRSGLSKRDGLASAAAAACADNGVLLVYAICRLGRSAGYIHNMADRLEDAGAHIASATEDINTTTAMGRAFFGLCAVFAQLESDQISERVKAARAHIFKTKGFHTMGARKFGWKLDSDGNLVPCPEELESVRRCRELAARMKPSHTLHHDYSWSDVAAELNRLGVPTISVIRANRHNRVPRQALAWTWRMVERYVNGSSGKRLKALKRRGVRC